MPGPSGGRQGKENAGSTNEAPAKLADAQPQLEGNELAEIDEIDKLIELEQQRIKNNGVEKVYVSIYKYEEEQMNKWFRSDKCDPVKAAIEFIQDSLHVPGGNTPGGQE